MTTLPLFSLIKDGNSDIYEMNLSTNQLTRLTHDQGIDTTPSYSPDGSKIVFSSDRSGTQKIYVMNSNYLEEIRVITSNKYEYVGVDYV